MKVEEEEKLRLKKKKAAVLCPSNLYAALA